MEEKYREFGNSLSVNGRYDRERVWSDGNVVNGYFNPDNRKLYLNNGNRDNRNPDNGPREKSLHKARKRSFRALWLEILQPAIGLLGRFYD